MKKFMKKALGLVLTLVMVLSLMPNVTANAAVTEANIDSPESINATYDTDFESYQTNVTVAANTTTTFMLSGIPGPGTLSITAGNRQGNPQFNLYGASAYTGEITSSAAAEYGYATVTTQSFDPRGTGAFACFVVENTSDAEISLAVTIVEASAIGAWDNPDTLVLDTSTTVSVADGAYYFTYNTSAAGVMSVNINTVGTGYTLYGYGETSSFVSGTITDTNLVQAYIEANDTVSFCVYAQDGYDISDVTLTASYEVGATLEEEEEEETGLKVGSNTVELGLDEYTVVEFVPTEAGTYKISIVDGVIGNLGSNPQFYSDPTASNVNATTVEWTCTGVGQCVVLGLKANDMSASEVTLNIVKEAAYVQETIFEEPGGLYITPGAYKYTGNPETLKRVNVGDATIDKAVLGADGYYHLNSANGPIILVDLDDKSINLHDAADMGQLYYTYTWNDGEKDHTAKVNYNESVLRYYDCSDDATHMYPLTLDLMDMLQSVGYDEGHGWYTESGYVGSTKDDAWMFCCFYNPEVTTGEAVFEIPPFVIGFEKDEKPVFTADDMDMLVSINDVLPVEVYTPVGDKYVVFTFLPNTMELVEGVTEYNFGVELVTDLTNFTNKTIANDSVVLRINYAYSGKLPGTAEISIPVDEKYNGQTLYYYLINADGTLTYVDAGKVEDGVITVTQSHCSDYVLSTQAPPAASVPATGDSMNVGLWAAILMLGLAGVTVVMRKKEI